MATSNGRFNRVQVLYNAEHRPYLYGVIHIVDGRTRATSGKPRRPKSIGRGHLLPSLDPSS